MSKSSDVKKYVETTSGLFKALSIATIFFFVTFLALIILPQFISPSLNYIILFLLFIECIDTCYYLLTSISDKRTLLKYPDGVKFNTLFNELQVNVIFVFIIYLVLLVLFSLPLFVPELNWINFIQPLSTTFGWLSLLEGITLGGLLPIFYHQRNRVTQFINKKRRIIP